MHNLIIFAASLYTFKYIQTKYFQGRVNLPLGGTIKYCPLFGYLVNFGIPGQILSVGYCSYIFVTLALSPHVPIYSGFYFCPPISMQSVHWGYSELFQSLLDTTFLQPPFFVLLLGRNNRNKLLKEMQVNNYSIRC